MREFEMVRTDEDKFSSQRTMLSMRQLRDNVDSLKSKIDQTGPGVVTDILLNLKRQPVPLPKPIAKTPTSAAPNQPDNGFTDRLGTRANLNQPKPLQPTNHAPTSGLNLAVQEINKPLNQYGSLLETFRVRDQSTLMKEAKTRNGLNQNIVESRTKQLESKRLEWIKTGYELYNKYSFALICFIFLFIGAPMGAIIRKGGFGYPILVSIIFFVTFVFLAILCRKLAETNVMSSFWAAMTPCAILAVFGLFVTRKAMNDSQLFSTERLERFIYRLRLAKTQKKSVDSL